jgi:hypothetical protein
MAVLNSVRLNPFISCPRRTKWINPKNITRPRRSPTKRKTAKGCAVVKDGAGVEYLKDCAILMKHNKYEGLNKLPNVNKVNL